MACMVTELVDSRLRQGYGHRQARARATDTIDADADSPDSTRYTCYHVNPFTCVQSTIEFLLPLPLFATRLIHLLAFALICLHILLVLPLLASMWGYRFRWPNVFFICVPLF